MLTDGFGERFTRAIPTREQRAGLEWHEGLVAREAAVFAETIDDALPSEFGSQTSKWVLRTAYYLARGCTT